MKPARLNRRPALARFAAWLLAVGLLSLGVLSTTLMSQGNPCTSEYFTFYPSEGVVGAAGGYGTVQFVKSAPAAACQTEAVDDASWLSVAQRLYPLSWGEIRYQAWNNDGPLARVAHIVVRGLAPTNDATAFRVTQQGAETCTYTINANPGFSSRGGEASVPLASATGSPNCRWTAQSDAPWVNVRSRVGYGNTAVMFELLPNFTPRSRSAVIRLGNQQIFVDQQANAAAPAQRFVELLYFSFLDRLPSVQERDAQVAAGLSPTDLALNFMNSEEFNVTGRFAAGLYVGLLDRDAEFAGWRWQRSAIAKGWITPDQLVENFLNSPEYQMKFGVPDNTQFVRLLYRHVLLREGAQPEIEFQAAALAAGTPRVVMARAFLNTTEFRLGTGARLTSFLLYSTLLLRDSDPAERAFRANQLASGTPLRSIIADIVASPELQALIV